MHPLQTFVYAVAPFWHLWTRFSRTEQVQAAVLVGLALAAAVSGILADTGGVLLLGLLWCLVLLASAVLSVLNALDRVGEHQMTANYLASYTGEHVHVQPDGARWEFDGRAGWRKQVNPPAA